MKFQIKWDIIRHAYANTHILLSAKCDLLKPPAMPEVFNRMHPQGILEDWKSTLYMKIPRYRLEEQRSAWPVKKCRWEEEEPGKQTGKIFVLRGRIFILSEKEKKGWTGTGEAGRKGRKQDRVCRRNRNGEGEVMLINTIYFISQIVFLKQDTFSCYSKPSFHNAWNSFNKHGYTLK